MGLKRIKWKNVFSLSLSVTITMGFYMFFTNQFSWLWTLISIVVFPALVIIISFCNPKVKKSNGCLNGKTEDEKHSYFESLYTFIEDDLIFYNEQLTDLLEDELEQFNMWIFNNKYVNK